MYSNSVNQRTHLMQFMIAIHISHGDIRTIIKQHLGNFWFRATLQHIVVEWSQTVRIAVVRRCAKLQQTLYIVLQGCKSCLMHRCLQCIEKVSDGDMEVGLPPGSLFVAGGRVPSHLTLFR